MSLLLVEIYLALAIQQSKEAPAPAMKAADSAWAINLECLSDEEVCHNAGLAVNGPALLDFFRKRTPDAAALKRITALTEQLGSDQFAVRQQASQKLVDAGVLALPALRQVMRGQSLEMTQRAQQCITRIEAASPPGLPAAAARLVRVRKPDGACNVLLAYLPFLDSEDEALEEEVLLALLAVGGSDGRVEPGIQKALEGNVSTRRAAAALVVGRWGDAEQRKQVHTLLGERDVKLRLRAAQGLVAGRDRAAVPALAALLTEAPLPLAAQAEDLLDRIGGPKHGAPPLGDSDESRRACRKAWEAWWQANAEKTDLAAIDLDQPLISTNRRAHTGTLRFLDAIVKGDQAGLRRTTDVPFALVGLQVIDKREELDKIFAGSQPPKEKRPFIIERILTVDEYIPLTNPNMKEFLGKVRKSEVRAVVVGLKDGGNGDRGTVIIRVTGSQAKVIGIDEYKGGAQK
jgi:hypothetical protein